MADKPILFSGPMVRALLAGTKTQTRRTINRPGWATSLDYDVIHGWRFNSVEHFEPFSPRIKVGDRLYVREHWRAPVEYDRLAPRDMEPCRITFGADTGIWTGGRFRQGMHMPRWASRITLHVTEVRVQRLQDIDEADAIAEGTSCWVCGGKVDGTSENDCQCFHSKIMAVDSYMVLWESINGERSWHTNPWVTATTFTVEKVNINQARTA